MSAAAESTLTPPASTLPQKRKIAIINGPSSSTFTTDKKSRRKIELKDKLEVLAWMRATGSNTTDAERRFGYERTTISRWRSGENKLQSLGRTMKLEETGSKGKGKGVQPQFKHRLPRFPELESALSSFIVEAEQRHVPISHDLLKAKGRSFMSLLGIPDAALQLSNGWLDKVQKRIGASRRTIFGEAGSVNGRSVEDAQKDLQKITAPFALRDIYNADETASFYRWVCGKCHN